MSIKQLPSYSYRASSHWTIEHEVVPRVYDRPPPAPEPFRHKLVALLLKHRQPLAAPRRP